MHLGDTIAAPASPPGRSARAVIRLSGPGVPDLLATLLDHPPARRGAHRARLRLTNQLTLPVLLFFFPAPASYTGEATAELLIPGNPFLVERIIARLTAHPSVRAAEPGEFSARAYLNGRLTVDQAEGVAALVAAESARQVEAARDLLTGRTGRAYRGWADELTTLLALVEAGIDFTDQEDVRAISTADLSRRLSALADDLDRHLGAVTGRSVTDDLPTVALIGAPNAGKSTLFNVLLARRRAVTSPTPGTTRDALAEPLDLTHDLPGASVVTLIDLAGLEPETSAGTAGPIESQMQQRARDRAAAADLILYCDPAGRFDPGPVEFLPPGKAMLRVRTKADLPGHSAPGPGGPDAPIPVCALDGWNLPRLRREIAQRTASAREAGLAALLPRHRLALEHARAALADALGDALQQTRAGRPADFHPNRPAPDQPELTAAALREALDALGELVGRIAPDEVLGRVFATFCIGK